MALFKGAPAPRVAGKGLLFQPNALETLVEAGELATGFVEALLATGPSRVGLRINLKMERIAGLAIGRARLVARAIRHHDGDLMVIRVDAVLHRALRKSGGFIAEASLRRNSAGGGGKLRFREDKCAIPFDIRAHVSYKNLCNN